MLHQQSKPETDKQEFTLKKLLYKGEIYKSIQNIMDDRKYRFIENGKIKKDQSPFPGDSNRPLIMLSSSSIQPMIEKQVIIKDAKNIMKSDLEKIKIQFAKQIQKERGRVRITNLDYLLRLKKKQQKQIVLQAKMILPSIKDKIFSKIEWQQSKYNINTQRNKMEKKDPTSMFLLTDTKRFIIENSTKDFIVDNNTINKTEVKKTEKYIEAYSQMTQTKEQQKIVCGLPEIQQFRQSFPVRPYMPKVTLNKFKETRDTFLSPRKQKDDRLERYKEFLFKINYTNNIYVDMVIQEVPRKLIYYVGKGNNSLLVKGLLKRRFWWVEGNLQQANFVWTQLKKKQIFDKQQHHTQRSQTKIVLPNQSRRNSCGIVDLCIQWRPPKPQKLETNEKILQKCQNIIYTNLQNPMKKLKKVRPQLSHNHMPGNCHLGNKKALFFNLREYCRLTNKQLFDIVPLTYHVGLEYKSFTKEFKRRAKLIQQGQKISNVWIVKPGENSNRGQGIHVIESIKGLDQLVSKNKVHSNGQAKTYIVQLYMHKPFLYHRRKFDIRHYMLITNSGTIRAYWYKEGYIRTSSNLFDLSDISNNEIHLTNDAIQKYSDTYGKYEQGNKLSYSEFQRYLDNCYKEKKYNFNQVLEQMKNIAIEAVKATFMKFDENNNRFNFEIFGLDFMLDQNLKPWLIEVNTNPCLQISSNLLGRIIPGMVEHAFRIGLDPLYPPPCQYPPTQRHNLPDKAHEYLRFEIIFSSETQGVSLKELYKNCENKLQFGDIQEDADEYNDEGHQINYVD